MLFLRLETAQVVELLPRKLKSLGLILSTKKRKEGRKKRRKEKRKEGREEGRKARKEGRKEEGKGGREEERKETLPLSCLANYHLQFPTMCHILQER
jgi:hypothetical protein